MIGIEFVTRFLFLWFRTHVVSQVALVDVNRAYLVGAILQVESAIADGCIAKMRGHVGILSLLTRLLVDASRHRQTHIGVLYLGFLGKDAPWRVAFRGVFGHTISQNNVEVSIFQEHVAQTDIAQVRIFVGIEQDVGIGHAQFADIAFHIGSFNEVCGVHVGILERQFIDNHLFLQQWLQLNIGNDAPDARNGVARCTAYTIALHHADVVQRQIEGKLQADTANADVHACFL